MRKIFYTLTFVFMSGSFGILNAQSIDEMKKQVETLKAQTELLNKKIDLEEEKLKNEDLRKVAQSFNRKSDRKADGFSSSDAQSTADNAKDAAKMLKKAESANKNLAKSNEKIVDLEGDVRKLEMKLDRTNYVLEMKEK